MFCSSALTSAAHIAESVFRFCKLSLCCCAVLDFSMGALVPRSW